MKYFFYVIAIILLLSVNLGFLGHLPIFGAVPNLLFLFCLFFALDKQSHDFFFVGLVSGLFLDFFSANFFGGFVLALLIVLLLLNLLAENFIALNLNWKSLTLILLGSLAVFDFLLWLYNLAAFKFHWSFAYSGIKIFYGNFFGVFFYNWLLAYPVYRFYEYLKTLIANLTFKRRGFIR